MMVLATIVGIAIPVWMAVKRKGYRGVYFAAAFVSLLLAVSCNAMTTTSKDDLFAMNADERRSVEIVQEHGPTAFSLYVGLFIGTVIGGAIFRAQRAPTRACPYCAESIKPEAKVCRFCHRDLA